MTRDARSRSGGRSTKKGFRDKEFAWMDSGDDLEAHSSPDSSKSASSSRTKTVPIEQVETLSQMARLAPGLQRQLKRGDVRPRELYEVARALARSKFFDADLFQDLAKEFRRVFKRRTLGTLEILDAVCSLAELNAYDLAMFEAACAALLPEIAGLPDANRQRLDAALKQVKHSPGEEFVRALKTSRRADTREACPMFWRGQCKWGPRCKLSHDLESFEGTMQDGKWRPPTQSGGKSVGYKQSADLFKADRCGALW